jgi:MYXO-CTERM domain-containing protein
VANAGVDIVQDEYSIVSLDGSGSTDPDGATLTYAWTQTAGPAVLLNVPTSARPTFDAPRLTSDTVLTFQLTVSNGSLSSTDTVNVTLRNVNAPPIADAGVNWSGVRNTVLRLDATGSWDPDPDAVLSFQWEQIFGPAVTLMDANTARPSFLVPDVPTGTEVRFHVIVSDGTHHQADDVRIGVIDSSQPPVANAGWNQSVNKGQMVSLDGSESSDPDHTVLSYKWQQLAGPPVSIRSTDSQYPNTYFDAPYDAADGTVLTFQLTVNDGYDTSTDTVDIVIRDILPPPVPNAGPDRTVDERTVVTLDGSGSYDPDGERLLYGWQQLSGPPVEIHGHYSSPMATFTAPEVTSDTVFTFQIRVSDGTPYRTDTVDITVRNVNRAPVAQAGPARTVKEHMPVTLDGRGSTDPEGDTLTYAWEQLAGPSVTLSGAHTAQPVFAAPDVTADSLVTFQLTVSDGSFSSTGTVDITVIDNHPPVTDAGLDQTVYERNLVTLDGRGSTDQEPDTALVYAWEQTAGPAVVLAGANTAQPTFTPEVLVDSVLSFQLTVSDGELTSTDTVSVAVKNVNRMPVARAGTDQQVNERTVVALDGSGSLDPDSGTVLTYSWQQLAGPEAELTGADTAQPTFIAPEVTAGTRLVFQLRVSDGELSQTDVVDVVVAHVNRPPVADAGPDIAVEGLARVTLDGRGSVDPDLGATLTYTWEQTEGPEVTLSGVYSSQPTLVVPAVSADVVLTFRLTVSDGSLFSSDTVRVTVHWTNRAPVAHVGAGQEVDERTQVTLDGRGSSDPDQDSLMYAWTQTAGPTVTLSGAASAQPTFSAPEVTGTTVLTFQLVVSDGSASSEPKSLSITVRDVNRAPVAHAGEDQTVAGGVKVTLGGRGEDPESDTLSYRWTQTAGPTMRLSGDTDPAPTFTAPELVSDTVLTFTLKVTDARGLSAEDSVSITVQARQVPPDGEDGGGAGCGCSSDSSAAGALMPLLLLGLALRSRHRWPVH